MNHYTIQQNSFAACEEMRAKSSGGGGATSAAAIYRSDTVVCPKPRRLGLLHPNLNEPCYVMPLRRHSGHHHQEVFDSEAGNELLDIIILAKGECGSGSGSDSAPYFCGSPPSRASNPLIQDARFRDAACTPSPVSPWANPTPSPRKGGCVRVNFGNNPAVRVEGFDCLDRDRRGCSIPALA